MSVICNFEKQKGWAFLDLGFTESGPHLIDQSLSIEISSSYPHRVSFSFERVHSSILQSLEQRFPQFYFNSNIDVVDIYTYRQV